MNIADVLDRHRREQPDHPVIEHGAQVVTYAGFASRVDATAANLRDAGIGAGDVVAIKLPDSIDHLVILYALARAGAVRLSLPASQPAGEQERVLRRFDVRALIAEASPGPLAGAGLLHASDLCAIEESRARSALAISSAGVDAASPVVIAHSSGTTGVPKYFVLTHAQVHERSTSRLRYIGAGRAERFLSSISLSFLIGQANCNMTLNLGATIVIPPPELRTDFLSCVLDQGITITNLPATQVRRLLTDDSFRKPRIHAVKLLMGSSMTTAQDRIRIRRQLTPNLIEGYGVNELGVLTVAMPADQDAHPDAVGRVHDDVQAQVVDDEDRPLPPGQTGHIRFRAPNQPLGYWNDPQATASAFRDGWFYPGDLAAIDAGRYVFLKGRSDDVISNEGVKFYPVEVEQALQAHPAVVEAATLGWPHSAVGEVAVACVVLKSGVTVGELQVFCAERISRFKVPVTIIEVVAMPKTASGKIEKYKLKPLVERYMARRRDPQT